MRKMSKRILRLMKLTVELYDSRRLVHSLLASCLMNLSASAEAPPLQLKTSGVNVPFSISKILALYSLSFSAARDAHTLLEGPSAN